MTIRVVMPGPWNGLTGTVVRTSASGGVWVRMDVWVVGEPDEFDGVQWFDRLEVEQVTAAKAA